MAVKRILRHLKGTMDFGLWYPKGENFTLTTYTDADCTSRGALFLGNWLVSYLSKKYLSISLSTLEAKCIVGPSCCTKIICMKQSLQDIKVEYKQLIFILCGNTNAISIFKNPMMHSKTKHVPIKYHFLRERVNVNTVKLEYVTTKEQMAYMFTKPLHRDTFEYLLRNMGFIPNSQWRVQPKDVGSLVEPKAHGESAYDCMLQK